MTSWCSVLSSRLLVIALCLALPAAAFAESTRGRRGGRTRARPGKARPAVKPQPPPEPTSPERRAEDAPRSPAKGGDDDRDLKRGERVEFDGRLIEGQTAASGAIYLFERLPSELRSMVTERRSYQREILETLYPNGAVPPPEPRADKAPR